MKNISAEADCFSIFRHDEVESCFPDIPAWRVGDDSCLRSLPIEFA